MKKLLFLPTLFFLIISQTFSQEIKPLYQLPEKISTASVDEDEVFLIGADEGLFKITGNNYAINIWSKGRVDQIIPVKNYFVKENENTEATEIEQKGWYIRTEKGIFYTEDLQNYEERDNGLSFLTIKKYENKTVSLEKQIQALKDLAVNPMNNMEMVTATKDNVYYTTDGGKNWKNIRSMSKSTGGIKAVAVATIDGESVVFMSHPIYGPAYIYPQRAKAAWVDLPAGFDKMPSIGSPDEIADILPVIRTDIDGNKYTEIYFSQSYMPRLYKLNWKTKKAEVIYKGTVPVDCYEGLTTIDNVLLYTHLEGFGAIDLDSLTSPGTPTQFAEWSKSFSAVPGMVNTAYIPASKSGFSTPILLNELWLLYPGTINSPYAEKADKVKSVYASAYQCRTQDGIDKFKKILKDRNMNSIVIDMKDDYGYLRYYPKDPLLVEKGTVTQYAIDLDHFIEEFKKDNIYLVARIVTFKDRSLTKYKGGKYAVWDSKYNKPWQGIKSTEEIKDDDGNVIETKINYFDENWCDPYSEEVWEYNVAVAKELVARGFDEIQFDYIRFPTDGTNLKNVNYRWQNEGMDKESALISFLSYARENIDAPIGIDIYGANGWYRSGARTGQDAEMLAEYVDVIGPMFYPSHFEQSFLNYAPYEDRTYRIYYYGSFRNTVICRNRAIIRPWIQCFYLPVSYDKKYYDSDYISREFFGTRDSINHGYMCWNNSGEYGITPKDVSDTEPYIGNAPEAAEELSHPAIGTKMKPFFIRDEIDISILDSILYPNYEASVFEEYDSGKSFIPFLQVQPVRGF
ncbi:MAG: hypothetical protein MJ188_01395 [Treponema sp.]|nr:hypothetical protein [Treponema sp.]